MSIGMEEKAHKWMVIAIRESGVDPDSVLIDLVCKCCGAATRAILDDREKWESPCLGTITDNG